MADDHWDGKGHVLPRATLGVPDVSPNDKQQIAAGLGPDTVKVRVQFPYDENDPRHRAALGKTVTQEPAEKVEPLPAQFAAGAKPGPRFHASGAAVIGKSYAADLLQMADAFDEAAITVHAANVRAGWWSNPATGEPIERNVFEMLALVHSEISEAVEGHRKGLCDDKLPHRPMIGVELADAVIRILDLAGAMRIPLGTVIAEKCRFNATRADHKPENRLKAGGKAV